MKKSPVITVIGPGAIGGITSAILFKNGYDVTLVTKHKELSEYISSIGLEIKGHCGSFISKVPTVFNISELKTKSDFVLIATKAGDMSAVAKQLNPLLKKDSLVVSLQNGIVEEELSSIIGKDRTVGCVVGWGATMHSKGLLEMTSTGEFVIGYLEKKCDDRLFELRDVLNNILQTDTSDEILTHLYSKLIINSCISTLGAVSGLLLGEMLNKKQYRNLFLAIIQEAINVANAMNLKVAPYAGKLNYYHLLSWKKSKQHIYLRIFGFKYRKLKSSSLQSLERGKKTEVINFNGYISMKGTQFEIPTPVNSKLTAIIMEIESGNRKITKENINDLL